MVQEQGVTGKAGEAKKEQYDRKAGGAKKEQYDRKADRANKKPMYEYTGFFVHLLRI